MKEKRTTYGAELEKPIANLLTGKPYPVSKKIFEILGQEASQRGKSPRYHISDLNGEVIGTRSKDLGEQGVDNGWNLLETALPYQTSLEELRRLMDLDLISVQHALKQEGASVINLSIHPLANRDLKNYKAFVAPKGIYPYLWYRGWDHTAGIDARAQNSPTTGVEVFEAADAVSAIIGSGAAFVGLFANSPYEEGGRSGYKEARLTMWERMMRFAKVEGDRITAKFPPERFRTLAQYFNWMFGRETAIHFVIASGNNKDYKGIGDRIIIIPKNPSVLEYLSQENWEGFFLRDIFNGFNLNPVIIHPDISHMEAMQFAQFAGARIRFQLNHDGFPLPEFLEACKHSDRNDVEKIFEQWAKFMYIEGRDPGANFPDEELLEAGEEVAQSVMIAPAAIQAGLIRNLDEAVTFIDSFNWQHLNVLRNAAIRNGLQGEADGLSVYDFTKKILEIAARGLTAEEQRFLRYPLWVLQTGKNGADRAIEYVEETHHATPLPDALKKLVIHRRVVIK